MARAVREGRGVSVAVSGGGVMRVLDLFSGIGGFSLGLERAGMQTVAFCEIDPYCRRVLAKHWPEVPCYEDVRTLSAERLAANGIGVDVICGGFPCQDISLLGTRLGLKGERSGLFSQCARLISELRPHYAILENVAELLDNGMGEILGTLAALGYDAEWHCIQAANVDKPHIRDRTWIVANPAQVKGLDSIFQRRPIPMYNAAFNWEDWASQQWPKAASYIRRIDDGLPHASHRISALGNAVVPQIPEMIGRAIIAHAAHS